MYWIFGFIALVVFSCACTGLLVRLAQRIALLDIPVARSSHDRPVPVGGGGAIAATYLVGLLVCLLFSDSVISSMHLAYFVPLVIALLGALDDRWHLDWRARIPVQLVCSVAVVVLLNPLEPVSLGLFTAQGWVLDLLAILALVWITNLYNFMDGIDGIAGVELLFVNLVSFIFVINAGFGWLSVSVLALLAGAIGFLPWNWSPARVFMGDTGSGFCGFVLGVLALLTMKAGMMNLWAWLLLMGVFVVDATYTLLWRFISGQRWYDGHASHAYQLAARHYKSHSKVTIVVMMINAVWLAPLAWLANLWGAAGPMLVITGYLPLLLIARKFGAGGRDQVSAARTQF